MLSKLKRVAVNAVLVFVSSLITLAALELALRLTQPGRPRQNQPQIQHVPVPADPTIGRMVDYYYLAPNQRGFTFDAPVSTNSIGIRNAELPAVEPPGRYRILTLGDSHTFGYAVEDNQTWPRQLEAKIRHSPLLQSRNPEVINAGIAGFSLAQEIQFFKDRLLFLRPDLVVLGYYWDDMPMQGDPFGDASEQNGDLRQVRANATENKARNDLTDSLKDLLRNSYLLYNVVQRFPSLQMRIFPTPLTQWKRATVEGRTSAKIDASWRSVAQQLAELKHLGDERGFEVVVLMIPLFEQMTSGTYSVALYQTKLAETCAATGLAVIDPLPAIRAIHPVYPDHFVPFDGHPNGKVYAVIADNVLAWLEKRLAGARS